VDRPHQNPPMPVVYSVYNIPIMQERELFHRDYEGKTLWEHLGAPDQYGIDPRV
jgi:hypothetical protein